MFSPHSDCTINEKIYMFILYVFGSSLDSFLFWEGEDSVISEDDAF